MQVTIGANCWDGMRRKSLPVFEQDMVHSTPESVRFLDKIKLGATRLNNSKVKGVLSFAIPLMLLAHGLPPVGITRAFAQTASTAMAMTPDAAVPVLAEATKDKILHAFDPLIHLVQSLAYPIAGVMIAGGCLFIMVGNREKGMDMLKNAAIGYILVQLTPLFLELLVGIGSSV